MLAPMFATSSYEGENEKSNFGKELVKKVNGWT